MTVRSSFNAAALVVSLLAASLFGAVAAKPAAHGESGGEGASLTSFYGQPMFGPSVQFTSTR